MIEDRRTEMTEALVAASQSVTQGRDSDYGDPKVNFERIAAYWSNHLGMPITAKDVAIMFILAKVSRLSNSPDHFDSWVDIAGYATLGNYV